MEKLKVTIEVEVVTNRGGVHFAPYVTDAVNELVNSRAFKAGRIADLNLLTHACDHGDVFITTTVTSTKEPM